MYHGTIQQVKNNKNKTSTHLHTLPTATPMHITFLSWNLTIALVSLSLASRDSWWETTVGMQRHAKYPNQPKQ
jgi:hypothetical protein